MDGEVTSDPVENNNKNSAIKMAVDQRDECEMMEVDTVDGVGGDGGVNSNNSTSANSRTENNGTTGIISISNNNNAHTNANSNSGDSAPSSPPPPPNKIARLSKSSTGRRSNSTSNNSSSKPPTPGSSHSGEESTSTSTKVNSVSPSHTPSEAGEETPNSGNDLIANGPNHVNEADEEVCKVELDKVKVESEDNSQSGGSSAPTPTANNGPVLNFSTPPLTKRSVTLPMLLAAGILKPGEGLMSLEYHGQKFTGDLLESGQIRSQETSQVFTSPSAWAIACKAFVNPEKIMRKSGCGWASIKYRGLKLDYYKTVWFKRLREGSIDIKNITNGTSSSDNSDDEGDSYCVLKFGEHFDSSPAMQSAQQLGAKILISCTQFKDIERLQPFYVRMSAEALALADLHCNITNAETVGYISGHWSGDENCLKMEVVHPCRVLMPNSSSIDCDTERNRIALEIQRLGHDVVGWYHSHPKAPPQPSKDDISRQLDYQVMMKGASESAYIPCVGVIISPISYSNQEDTKKSSVQFYWVMPPHENRPLEMGRPMHVDYEVTSSSDTLDTKKLLLQIGSLVQFYRENKGLVDINDLAAGKLDKIIDTIGEWIPKIRHLDEFWDEVKQTLLTSPSSSSSLESNPPHLNSVQDSEKTTTSSLSSTGLNSICASNISNSTNSTSTPNSMASASTPPTIPTPTPADEPMQ